MTGLAFRLALRNLIRHRRRTARVGLGIVIGAAAVVVHGGLVAGIRDQMLHHLVISQYGHAAVSATSTRIHQPEALGETLRATLPWVRIEPTLSTLGMAFGEQASTARIALWGIDAQQGGELLQTLLHRAGGAATLQRGSVFLGAALARRLEVERGDPVTIMAEAGETVGAALAGYSSGEARAIAGQKSDRIPGILGYPGRSALVHRDDMVMWGM